MRGKTSWHIQGQAPEWLIADIRQAQPAYVKQIDPGAENLYPASRVIGRVWIGGDGNEAEYIARGAAGASAYYERCLSAYQGAHYVHAWEGPNEPAVATAEQRRNLSAFTRAWMALMHADGRRVVTLSLSVGWPDTGTAAELRDAIVGADYVGLHEYGAPEMWTGEGWYAMRYLNTLMEWHAANIEAPPVLITECGIDGGVEGRAGEGWRTYTTEGGYCDQLAWYDERIGRDERVAGAFVFTAAPTSDWHGFEITPDISAWLAQRARKAATMNIDRRKLTVSQFLAMIAESRSNLTGLWDEVEIHHTASKPADWQGLATIDGLKRYYEGLGWDSGPHVFVCGDDVYLFTPLAQDGTGIVGRNRRTRHIEIVGDYTSSLPDAATWQTAAIVAAELLQVQALDTDALHYHRQYQKTECPGQALVNAWPMFKAEVQSHLAASGPDAEQGDAATLVEKTRWWAEYFQRLHEEGNDGVAWALWPAYIRLVYRAEHAVKAAS